MDEDKKLEHESYGMVAFNRQSNSGGATLFGSPLSDHYQTVSIRIATGYAWQGLMGEQRYRGERQIVEVELSAAQFAEAITTMGLGDGVPCTIRRLNGRMLESPPRPPTATERAHEGFAARMKGFGKTLRTLTAKVDAATESLTQKKRAEVRGAVAGVVMEVEQNIPFFLELFTEAAVKVTNVAKAEADAWLTTVVHRAGLAHLRGLPGGAAPVELPALPEQAAAVAAEGEAAS